MKILIIDDDPAITSLLEEELVRMGHSVAVAIDGYEALAEAHQFNPDCALVDIRIPGIDGRKVAGQMRQEHPCMGIIMLTALDDTADKVEALSHGADDYIVKPFHIDELNARIGAVSRRWKASGEDLKLGGIELVTEEHRVFADGEEAALSKTEFSLLYFLMHNPGIVFSRARLLEVIWSEFEDKSENLVEVYINYLRKKLGKCSRQIKTVRGVGYTFRAD
ncbi:MAG: response regulator transcription factor [Candidatus Xenobiia bacterium LiM19]